MKVAIVTTGNLTDMKGIMNYVQEKMRLMQERVNSDFTVDNYFVNLYPSPFVSWLHHTLKGEKLRAKMPTEVNTEGVVYRCINLEQNLIDTVMAKLQKEYIPRRLQKRALKVLGNYDVLATHQLPCHYLARANKMKNGVPYVSTWHGSDIHTTPKKSGQDFLVTKQCIESAGMNLFVSKALMEVSEKIAPTAKKDVIYTGPSAIFHKFDEVKRKDLRKQFNVEEKKVIAFVGNLVSVKNPLVLPEVFTQIYQNRQDVVFWIIGDGVQYEMLKKEFEKRLLPHKLFGRIAPQEMPDLMNVIDVLIVPSKEEGLGLVILEARSCGAACVTARVGGMPEVVGLRNSFPHDADFSRNVAGRTLEILETGNPGFEIRKEFSWEAAIDKEIGVYNELTKRN